MNAPLNSHTAIWNAVCTTDPKHTKAFHRPGGFRGTAINATYLVRKATEYWGPCGIGWGYEVMDEALMQGSPLENGVHTLIHKVRLKFWYVQDGQRGEVMHFGQTTFVGKDKNGIFTDEEAPKKSVTDALSKCLSMLGFGADVHIGLYDDNKYVAEIEARLGHEKLEQEAKVLFEIPARQGLKALQDAFLAQPKDRKERLKPLLDAVYKPMAQRVNNKKRLEATIGELKLDRELVKAKIMTLTGHEHFIDISPMDFDDVLAAVRAMADPAMEESAA